MVVTPHPALSGSTCMHSGPRHEQASESQPASRPGDGPGFDASQLSARYGLGFSECSGSGSDVCLVHRLFNVFFFEFRASLDHNLHLDPKLVRTLGRPQS